MSPEDLKYKKYYREEVLPNDPYYKIVKKITSLGTDMIPGVGEIKLLIENFVGYDLLTKEKRDFLDAFFVNTLISKGIADRGFSRFENQIFVSKINNTPKLIEYKPNSTGNENQLLLEYKPNNMFPVVYKPGNTSLVLYDNSKLFFTPVVNNSIFTYTPLLITDGVNKVSQVPALPNYLTKPEYGGIMVIGAGTEAKSGAYNIDINPKVGGIHFGDATNLKGIPDNSLSLVIIENPNGFDPLNPEILRVVKEGGEIEITGIKSNKEFFNIYSGKVEVPKGFEIIEVGEIPENFQKQGFRTDGKPIGIKNGESFPKKTDKIIRIRKIKK